jgi:cytochrome c-type biogenesis protein CcmE
MATTATTMETMASAGSKTSPLTGARRPMVPLKFAVGGAVIALALAYLAYVSLGTATVYYFTVGELRARGPSSQIVRVSGKVEPGSVVRQGTQVHFAVVDDAGRLPVVYTGVVPDIFAENIDVVVEGRYADAGMFRASNLLTKCPSRFESDPGVAAG